MQSANFPQFALLVILFTFAASNEGSTIGRHLLSPKDRLWPARKQEFAKPDFSLYHASDVLLQQIKELASRHPDKLLLEVQELELEGYAAELHSVTFAIERFPDAGKKDLRIRALLDFGQHGREPITSEVALRLLLMLVGEWPVSKEEEAALKEFLPHLVLKVVPMENINGRKKVEGGALCERKNGRGVDTNRNWAVDWGKKEKDYLPEEECPGTGPFSEPEAELLRRLASTFQPHLWVNVHSGMEALFIPYDHRKGVPEDGSAVGLQSMLHGLNEQHLNSTCVIGSGGSAVGYLAHGTATDWMYDELHVPIACTFEIYGDNHAHHDDCFRMFNPTTAELFETVVSKWSTAFLALLLRLPDTLKQISFRLLPQHAWSLAPSRSRLSLYRQRKSFSSFLTWGRRRDQSSPFLENSHLRRRKGVAQGREELVRGKQGGFPYVMLLSMCAALLLLLRVVRSHWYWCWWRCQMAFSGKKESHV